MEYLDASGLAARCAVCGEKLSGPTRVTIAAARLVSCGACASWTYLPRPDAATQAALHDTADYFDHPYFQARRRAAADTDSRCRELFARIARCVPTASLCGKRLLDIGCDTGGFLESAKRQFGIEPVGLDVSARAVAAAQGRGIEAYHAPIERAPSSVCDFPLVTAIDLIEHVADPGAFLQTLRPRMRRGGLVYLETPNADSLVYGAGRLLCGLTAARPRATFERLFPAQHVQYISEAGLRNLARQCGFGVELLVNRVLPRRDLATSWIVGAALMTLQALDTITGNMILTCALLRREE